MVIVLTAALAADMPVAGDVRPVATSAAPAGRPRIDRRPPIATAVATSQPFVALTFDDGPDPRWTPQVLEELERKGARATFFVTGTQARAHPELLRAIVASGNEVANHTDTHPHMDGLDAAAVTEELREASDAIGAAGVLQAPYFRPPRGRYGTDTMSGVAATGLLPVGWTVCLERWLRDVEPEDGARVAALEVRAGGIVLAHDGGVPDREPTVRALPSFLDGLTARGFKVVTLSELVRLGPLVLSRPGADPRAASLTRVGPHSPR